MKRIALVATGGTIAGRVVSTDEGAHYTAGVVPASELLAAVPGIAGLADIVPESPYAIDSKDITPEHWLVLARRVAELIDDAAIDGIVITHGTDTLEETAWLLHLTLPAKKPVVLTCAMRPADAPEPDGPTNLYQAVAVAAAGLTAGLGVVVVCNGEIHAAREVSKRHTQALDAIVSPGSGPLGRADPPRIDRRPPHAEAAALPVQRLGRLPEIPIIEVPGGSSPFLLHVLIERNPEFRSAAGNRAAMQQWASRHRHHVPGVVLALPGNGSLPESWRPAVEAALAQGIVVVRASRTGAGHVSAKAGVPGIAAGTLTPKKARIALMLALASGRPEAFASLAGSV